MKVIIAIPTYNEAENIVPLIREIFERYSDVGILVVDDGSPDGTGRLVREAMGRYPNLRLLERSGKLGLASAYLAAFHLILSGPKPEFIVTMDADWSHHPRYIGDLLAVAQTADFVIGSRYISSGGVKNWSLYRKMLSRFGNYYARLVTGIPIHDLTAGFSCMRVSFLEKLPWRNMQAEGYAWLIELKMLFHRAGARLNESPIIFEERRAGASKISRRIIAEGLIYPWRLRFNYRGR